MIPLRRNVQAALLHLHPAVREAALRYFVEAKDPSPSLLPTVIKAATRYKSHARELLFRAASLSHSRFTIQWILDRMREPWDQTDREQANYRFTLALLLLNAPWEQLLQHRKEILAVRAIPPELEVDFDETLKMHKSSWDTLWEALKEDKRTEPDLRREDRIIRALSRHKSKAPFVLRLMQDDFQGEDPEFVESIGHVLVELAGRMQIHAAVPMLFQGLAQGCDHVHVPVMEALLRLDKHTVVQEIIQRWPTLVAHERETYGEVLSRLHIRRAVEFGLKVFMEEPRRRLQRSLAGYVLEQFTPETVLPIYQYLLSDKRARNDTLYALPRCLVTVAMVTGKRFDDYDAYVERMDAQYREEQELSKECEAAWLADDYEELATGPAPTRKLSPQTAQCFVLSVKELGYLGRLRVPDLTLEELHEVLTVVESDQRDKHYTFKCGNRRFTTCRGVGSAANPVKTPLSAILVDREVLEYFRGAQEFMGLQLRLLRRKVVVGKRVLPRFSEGTHEELSDEDVHGLFADGPIEPAATAGKINKELRRIFR